MRSEPKFSVAVLLASNTFITGQTINVNAGRYMRS
jgi:hypothetical protein